MMSTQEILDAFLKEVPEAWGAEADDESSFGFEWHFSDGSVFWVDIDPATGPTYLWRKGKDGQPETGALNAEESK
jgi:hypothetical protein